jgi:putative effector of murein hydrolase LrgA (UPF0299 family)
MLRNFTVLDVAGSIQAALLLSLFLFIPGFVIGWISNVFEFRARRLATQILLSSPLAVAIVPIFTYFAGRFPKVLWVLFASSWLVFFVLATRIVQRWRSRGAAVPKTAWIGIAFTAIWAATAIATLVDLQFGHMLYFSSTAYDYSTRTAFTAAAVRVIPPYNPFFASDPPVGLRYHYFWMLICSLPARLGHMEPQQAMYGGTIWAGIVLMSLIVISLKFFIGVRERLERKAMIACSLLLVTGLDILPTLYIYLHWHQVNPDMEWWTDEQITSWIDSLLWVPHHVMSLVACMVGLLVLRQPAATKYRRAVAILIAGLAFASSAGLSILVAFTFAFFGGVWLIVAAQRKWWDEVKGLLAAGGVALLAAFPYLYTLAGPALDGSARGGRFFALSIRRFSFGTYLVYSRIHIFPQTMLDLDLILLTLLPVSYFLELGFFFVVGVQRITQMRRRVTPMSRNEGTAWLLVAISFLIGSFVRSTTITSNDLGWRCFLPAQLILLLWAAVLIDEWWSKGCFGAGKKILAPMFAAILLIIGVLGTTYQVAMLRMYPILQDEGKVRSDTLVWLERDHELGQRTYALRSAYSALRAMLPVDAVVQYNPNATDFIPHELYSGRSAAMGLPHCGANFGGDVSQCEGRVQSVAPLFDKPSQNASADLDTVCRQYRIEVMVVDDSDPVWGQRDSWAWSRKPLLANSHVRAFTCGDAGQQVYFAPASVRGNSPGHPDIGN